MAKLKKPNVLIYGSLVGSLLVAVTLWWTASHTIRAVGSQEIPAIPGMRSASIYSMLERQGFRKEKDDVAKTMICKKGRQLVEVFEKGDGVSLVRVTVRPLFRTDGVSFAPEDAILYGLVAMTSYDGAKTSLNQAWATGNFHKSARRDDGKVSLETRASDNIRILLMKPSRAGIDS